MVAKRKGPLAARESVMDIRTVPCPGFVTALHGHIMSHLQSHFLLLASISLREKLINAAEQTNKALLGDPGTGRKGAGAKQEALSLSWQGAAGEARKNEVCGWNPLPLAFLGELLASMM